MARTILVVDDEMMNREILKNMLGKEYDILTAASGSQALVMLREKHAIISALLLDLKMPDMDGYDVLRAMRVNEKTQSIPVIVATSMNDNAAEEKAIALGAYGFVTKPYRSVLIKRHLYNAITFRENASLQNQIKRDDLTNLLNMRGFSEQAEMMIKSQPMGYYMLSCFDIDSFKVINDQYGNAKGDEVLKFMAKIISDCVTPLDGICCRVSSDDFVTLYPAVFHGCNVFKQGLQQMSHPTCITRAINIRIGRYRIDDQSVSVSTMYDRAILAKDTIRGKYNTYEATYDDAMRDRLLREQQIVSEMGSALANHQFEVWFQPQFNHASGSMIGAEALVRWRHPTQGLIPPLAFIPAFERNGFIYSLDRYVWEEVCACLRKWIDQKRNPLPVSVNISREDMTQDDIVQVLVDLTSKYSLDLSLLRLEITETAFAESSDLVASVVKRLIARGFTVEIDDFGSGYSSLNTLKDIPAQIIKLDMKFFSTGEDDQRGGNIIESVVRMAKWLGMSVIAEGVETLLQADYLRSVGCQYIQGYLYSKPMPLEQYEQFCTANSKEEHLLRLETVDNLDNNSFWDPKSMDTLIFNSYVGGACIFEYHNGGIELLRASQKYAQVIGSVGMTVEDALKLDWTNHLDAETLRRVMDDLETSINTKNEVTGEYVFHDLPNSPSETYLRSTMRVIASTGERYLVYCTNENVTAQRKAEREAREANEQLLTMMNDTPGGFARLRMYPDGTGVMEYANDGYCRMIGATREEVMAMFRGNLLYGLHPDDCADISAQIKRAFDNNELITSKFRMLTKSGEYIWLQNFARFTKVENGDAIINCYYADLSEADKRQLNLRETMPFILSAIMESSENLDFAKDKDFHYICGSPAFLKFTRQKTVADLIGKNDYDIWTKEEADHFRNDDMRLFAGGKSLINYTEPIPSDDGIQHYSVTSKYIIRDSSGEIIGLYGSGRDITDTRMALDRLQLLTDSIPGGIATYVIKLDSIDITYFNDGFCGLFGCTREEYEQYKNKHGVVSLVFPEDLPGVMAQVDALLKHGSPIDCVYRSRKLDGSGYHWLNLRGIQSDRYDDTVFVNAVLYDVTARMETEQRLKTAAEQLESLMSDMPGGFVRVRLEADGSYTPVYINAVFERLLDITHAQAMQLVGEDLYACIHPDDAPKALAANNAVIQTQHLGDTRTTRYRFRRGDGSYIWLTMLGRVTSDPYGGTFLNLYFTDESEQIKEEDASRALLDNLPCGAGVYEFSGGQMSLIYQNKSYWSLVGLHDEAYPDTAPMSAVHPDDIAVIMSELQSAVIQSRDVHCDIRLRHLTKGYRPVHLAGRIVHYDANRFRVYTTFTPIDSSEMTYQQTLPLLLHAIMESTSDFAFAKDKDFRYMCCSPAFLRMVGRRFENDVVGKTDFDLFPADTAQQFRKNDLAVMETGEPMLDYDETVHAPDGFAYDCLSSKHVLRDAAGACVGVYGVSRDVTKVRDTFEQLKLVSDSIPGGIATYAYTCGEVSLVYCNDGFSRLFGGTRESLEKRGAFNPMDWVFDEDRDALMAHIKALAMDGTPFDVVFRTRVIGGGYKWINEKAVISQRRGDTILLNAILLDITELQNYIEQLRISEEENSLAMRLCENIIGRFSIADRTLSLQPDVALAHNLPESVSDVPYGFLKLGMVAPESEQAYIDFFESIIAGGKSVVATFKQLHQNEWRWYEAKSSLITNDSGEAIKAIISFTDITDKVEREAIYKKWQQSLSDRKPDTYTLYRCNVSKRSDYNAREGSLLAIQFPSHRLSFNERTALYVGEYVFEDDCDRLSAFLSTDTLLADFYRGSRVLTIEYREKRPTGGTRWLKLTVDLVDSPYSTDVEAYLLFEDIDESKRRELKMKELSESDPLTGILNRNTFSSKVNEIIRTSKPGVKHALLMMDIDSFKLVNDVFGHVAGDQMLIDTAKNLRSIMRRDDLVARMGGDEFVVFLCDVHNKRDAAMKARQICGLVRKSFSMEVQTSASVGITIAPNDGTDFDTLYRKADAAMYYVKGSGKDNYAFYTSQLTDEHLTPEADVFAHDGAQIADKKRRMLIVDDSTIDYEMLQNIFKDDFIIETAKDGYSALVRLRHYGAAISVVLLDLMMPGLDGFSVLEKMQENADLRSVPVVIVSGDERRETCLKAIRKGATDFITKPVDADILRIRVHSAVSKAENERLRVKNRLLEALNDERVRYDSALEGTGITFMEMNVRSGTFAYYPSVASYLFGTYDHRPLWTILLSDEVTDADTVRALQALARRVAEEPELPAASMTARLKTPQGAAHHFRITVRRMAGELNPADKLILSLNDLEFEVQYGR